MPKRNWTLIPMLAALAACVTHERLRTVDTSCTVFVAISYAQLPQGQADDPGNQADSTATVKQIERHNAAYDRLCLK